MLAGFIAIALSLSAYSQKTDPGLSISKLQDDFYIYTTYQPIDGSPFPSNSMYIVTTAGVVLIDTPWDESQTAPLLDSIWKRHALKVILCVVTHSHDDRTAGLDILNQKGIPTYSSLQSKMLAIQKSEKKAGHCFTKDTTFKAGNISFETFYPGEGHTKDNLVVWFPAQKILYGGCLVKSMEAKGLGNIKDANLDAWPGSIQMVQQKFKHPNYIIPGHMGWRSKKALKHTLKLLKNAKEPFKRGRENR